MKKLDGKISILRWHNCGGVTIKIEDSNSWCGIVEATMTVEDFANCLFGNSHVNCKLTAYDTYSKLGKFPIHKNILSEADTAVASYGPDRILFLDKFAKKAVKQYEVDGWLYKSHNLGNYHYRILKDGKAYFPITMMKFVDTLEEAAEWEKAQHKEEIQQ